MIDLHKEIAYKELVDWEGRNGMFSARALLIDASDGARRVQLYPVTTKGQVGRCLIEIPVSAISEVIAHLQYIRMSMLNKTDQPDC